MGRLEVRLRVFSKGSLQLDTTIDGEMEVGRQRADEPEPFQRTDNGLCRLIIAPRKEATVSRKHLKLVPDGASGLNIFNTSRNCPIMITPDRELLPGKTCYVSGRTQIHVQQITLLIDPFDDDSERTVSLGTPSPLPDGTLPLSVILGKQSLVQTLGSSFDSDQTETLLTWLRLIASLFHHVDDRTRFAREAAIALQGLLGSDASIVLEQTDQASDEPWAIIARTGSSSWSPPASMLARMSQMKQSILSESADQLAIVTPVMNSTGHLAAAVAVFIQRDRMPANIPIALQVGLLELIASGLRPST